MLAKHRLLGPIPDCDSAGLGWDLRICISDVFPSNVDVAGLVTTYENHCSKEPKLYFLEHCPWAKWSSEKFIQSVETQKNGLETLLFSCFHFLSNEITNTCI